MNPEQPQNKKSDFTEDFDNDEMEINVSYEEITPEEQLEIKNRVAKTASSDEDIVNSLSDMWLENNPEIAEIKEPTTPSKTQTELPNTDPSLTSDETNAGSIESELGDSTAKSGELEMGEIIDEVATESQETSPSMLDDPAIEYSELEVGEIIDETTTESQETSPSMSEDPAIEYSELEVGEIIDETATESQETSPESSSVLDDFTVETKEKFNDTIIETEALKRESNSIEDNSTEDEIEILDPSKPEPNKPYISETPKTDDLEEVGFATNQETNSPDSELIENNIAPPTTTTELIADSWLDESADKSTSSSQQNERHQELTSEITQLERQKASLQAEINELRIQKEAEINQQTQEIAENLRIMIIEGTRELKERKNNLLVDIEKLERRKERVDLEMRRNFAGASQDLAVRVQGFKEYLVGSLQDLATAAERLDLPSEPKRRPPREPRQSRDSRDSRESREPRQSRDTRDSRDIRRTRNASGEASTQPQFTEQTFAEQNRRIRQLLDKYRTQPDYYGAPWQLRRTFEPIHAERVQEWFFERGGRGTIKGMGSRLQNILVASAIISVLYRLYRDRVRILVLVDTPEKLGEWRKGVQDCLGVSRNDFGSNRGIVLFESADVLVQRADRLLQDKLLPIIIIDETEELVNLALLKFPLWLAFAEKPQSKSSGYLY